MIQCDQSDRWEVDGVHHQCQDLPRLRVQGQRQSHPLDGGTEQNCLSSPTFYTKHPQRSHSPYSWFPQVFFLQSDDQPNGLSDPADHSRLTENVARAFCMALCPHLKLLKEDGMAKLGLRVTLDSDQV